MRRYAAIVRNMFLESLNFRADFIFMVLGNLVGVFLAYYLWRAVYAGSGGTLHGLGFLQAFAYVAVSGCIFTMIETWAEWDLAMSISRGDIVLRLHLPLDLHLTTLVESLGIFLTRLVFTGVPFLLLIIFAFGVPVAAGINLIFFTVSLFFSFLISFNIDFIVGVTAFSFESVLGLKLIKDAVILFLSGAVIPLAFFPEALRPVLMVLPFQAMYYTPVNLLLGEKSIPESVLMLLIQAGWIAAFMTAGRLFHRKILGKLTVSGG
ncbi:MAG: ABC-2 family transporter protein [Spirochaetales bacterium]|nr:ABC-2 family transporter protein [Spirochaetales bacterium]